MLKTKIAVFVSGGGTNLQALIDAQIRGEIPSGEICLVVSNKETAYALERAKNHGIAAAYVPKKGGNFEERLNEVLEAHEISMIVLAGFLCILNEDFTKKWFNRIINIHPSLIPAFCGEGFYGLKVHEEALKRGVKLTGATVHYVNEIADGGEIIMQKAVEVKHGDTAEILQKRVMEEAEWIILPQATELVAKSLHPLLGSLIKGAVTK